MNAASPKAARTRAMMPIAMPAFAPPDIPVDGDEAAPVCDASAAVWDAVNAALVTVTVETAAKVVGVADAEVEVEVGNATSNLSAIGLEGILNATYSYLR
jgi:hypothetical protein